MSDFQDICFPKDNEKEFVDTALKLGTKALIFVYPYKDKKTLDKQKEKISKIKKVKAEIGVLVDDKTVEKIQNIDDYIFAKTPSRKLVESRKTYVLFDFEQSKRNDFMHHRNAGVNQVIAKIIKDKKKIIGFSFNSLLNSKNPGTLLGRTAQNAKLARKYNLKTVVASFAQKPAELRAQKEIKSFEKVIGL